MCLYQLTLALHIDHLVEEIRSQLVHLLHLYEGVGQKPAAGPRGVFAHGHRPAVEHHVAMRTQRLADT